MILKGMIKSALKEVALESGNICYKQDVDIYSFKQAGLNNNSVLEALVCFTPGNFSGYEIGSIVFVGFEGDDIDHPVIIGSLLTLDNNKPYTNVEATIENEHINNLEIYQQKTDGSLNTKEKNLVGAINEIYEELQQK